MDLGGPAMIDINIIDVINQYSLLSIPFLMIVGLYVLSRLNMSER